MAEPEAPQGYEAIASHLTQNVQAIIALQARADDRLSRQDLAIERFIGALARPQTTWIVALVALGWCVANTLAGPRALDPPPFSWLQGAVGICALMTTIMVLTVQQVQGRRADQRAHLDLQINLLAEQKVAKVIALVEELRRDLPNVNNRRDSLAEAMAEPANPTAVASALDQTLSPADTPTPSGGRSRDSR